MHRENNIDKKQSKLEINNKKVGEDMRGMMKVNKNTLLVNISAVDRRWNDTRRMKGRLILIEKRLG